MIATTDDDFKVVTNDDTLYSELVRHPITMYNVNDQGPAALVLSRSVNRNRNTKTLHTSEPKLATTIVNMLNLYDCRLGTTPYALGVDITATKDEIDQQKAKYP